MLCPTHTASAPPLFQQRADWAAIGERYGERQGCEADLLGGQPSPSLINKCQGVKHPDWQNELKYEFNCQKNKAPKDLVNFLEHKVSFLLPFREEETKGDGASPPDY